jgi:cyclic pyranopterin phosphate synthase
MIRDTYNRTISYLRLSVTDRCNLRCQYCVPRNLPGVTTEGVTRKAEVLSYEDLFRLARESVGLGIRKIRVTGGEPLVRPGIVEFLERIARLEPGPQVVLTTNGILLKKLAVPLREAGVKRLNISLDSLDDKTFKSITGGGDVNTVLGGIDAAQRAGFPAPQINVVVLRGINDHEIPAFAKMASSMGLNVRFIEYMPITGDSGWKQHYMPSHEVLERIAQEHRLTPVESVDGAGPAKYLKLDDGPGMVGVISPISDHFCASCNRIRISADGQARGCLLSEETTDLKPYLERDDEAVREILKSIILHKPERHKVTESETSHGQGWVPMSAIGG